MLSSAERRKKNNWNSKLEILWQNMRCPGLEVEKISLQCSTIVGADNFQCSHSRGLQISRFSRTGLGTRKSLSGCGRNTGGRYFFYFWILGLLTLLWEKRQRLSKHYHQHCYWELEYLSFCPDPQWKLRTLHPKWIMSCASWLLSVHLDLLTTFPVLFHQPTDLVPGFLPKMIPTTLLLKKTPIPVDHCDPGGIQPSWCGLYLHSCPVLPRFSTALYSEVRVLKPNS